MSNLLNYLKDRERITSVAHLCRFNLQKYGEAILLLSKNESNYKLPSRFLGDGVQDTFQKKGMFLWGSLLHSFNRYVK